MIHSPRPPIPLLERYGLTGLEIDTLAASLVLLKFMGIPENLPPDAVFEAWTFAFFGVLVLDIDYSRFAKSLEVRSFSLAPLAAAERDFNFGVDLVLTSGGLKLKCYDYHCFSRPVPR